MMYRTYISIICLMLLSLPLCATEHNGYDTASSDTVTFADRISIHTNSIGWVLLTPNMAVEYDIVQNSRKKISLLLSGRYNWNSSQKFPSRYVYNDFGVRGEARWYFRTRKRQDWENEMVESAANWYDRMLVASRFVRARRNPKLYRAYYVGPYVAYDDFSLSLGTNGRQGSMYGAGVSFGYTAPLYWYENGNSIDFEIGASVGVHYADYEKYGYNKENKCYTHKGEKKGIVPYPMLSDVRLSLVYRFNPIQNQILDVDYDALGEKERIYRLMQMYEAANAQYVTSDTIFLLNRLIKDENEFVEKVNRRISDSEKADSTMLLVELSPLYSYLQLPKNMLRKKDDILLPNKAVDSVSQLGVAYLDRLVSDYSQIVKVNGVASVESRILQDYNSLREILLINNDTVSGISYYDLLVKAVPNINEFCIKPHNEVVELYQPDTLRNDTVAARTYFLGYTDKGQIKAATMSLVEYSNAFYLKDTIATKSSLTENERIKAENLVRVRNAERLLGITIKEERAKRKK